MFKALFINFIKNYNIIFSLFYFLFIIYLLNFIHLATQPNKLLPLGFYFCPSFFLGSYAAAY